MATRKRRRDPDRKKRRILQAATELIREHGVDKTKTSDIAHRAEVSEGTIFHHFGNRRGLHLAVAAQYGHRLAVKMFEGILPGQRPNVPRMIRGSFEFAKENGRLEEMLMMANDPATASHAVHAAREVVIAALTQAFVQWRAAGYIETDHPDIAASLLYGLVKHGVHECGALDDPDRMEDYIEEAVACVEGALGYEGHEIDEADNY